MMKIIYLGLLYSLFTVISWGQIAFEQVGPLSPAPANIANFNGATLSSIAFADIDNDQDQDVLITGHCQYLKIAKLYTNDGNGNYSEVTGTPFDEVDLSAIAFVDIDNDNDQDVLITGRNNSNEEIAKLYTNDGSGNFTEVSGIPFDGVENGSIAFADIDNDNDQDVLITGQNSSDQRIAKLYTNDGSGNFTEVSNTPFDGVYWSSIAFADIDKDNDQDVLITGQNNSDEEIAKLYTNDGSGNFTEVSGIPFNGVRFSSIDFADVDNDNDQDVLITGFDSSAQSIAKLYTNDGNGDFSEVSGTPFDGVELSSIAFADIDNDNDQDVLITGHNGYAITKLYTNDGSGSFAEVSEASFVGICRGSIAFADIDNDNDQDVLLVGENANYNQFVSKLYINDGIGNFKVVTGSPFSGAGGGSISFADINNDNNVDILITGLNSSRQRITELYSNDGNGNFSLISGTPFEEVFNGSTAFADIDNDNDQDLLITGQNGSYQRIAMLYTNDGSGNFTKISGTPFEGVIDGSAAFADIDNDNDLDVLITGENSSSQSVTKLYTNDGAGNFSEVTTTPFDGVKSSSIAFADIDNDKDMDVLITGDNASPSAKLYTNNGNGNFTEVSGTPFEGVNNGSVAFADIDNDNDLDVLITGFQSSFPSFRSIAKLYTNDGNGNFTIVTGVPFYGVSGSSVAFSDFDNDMDKDVIITGYNGTIPISKLFTNDGSGNFSELSGIPFSGVSGGSIAVFDMDNDNDNDVIITGNNSSKQPVSYLYRNISCFANTGTDIQSACGSFTWIDGVTYTSSNNSATFTLTNAAGCDSIVTLNLTIHTIDVNVSLTGSTISANETGASYQWINCNNNNAEISGETSNSFTATSNGNYAVIITKNGCSDTSGCVTISTVGIEENSLFDDVSVYPNPNDGLVNINIGNLKNTSLKVFNVSGHLIYKKDHINESIFQFDLSGSPAGFYFIEICTQGVKQHFKLAKR